ncbi:MAG: SDR family NAD(P)-dependent oxidoreductase [Acidobacteria bacterium]|nr:SDR family NAD(P)-dependent oxidoreductase [Acidobacteriota bacterium]
MELKGKTILVTGATGFIGHRLVERLAKEEGVSVRALARTEEKSRKLTKDLNGISIEIAIGDLSNLESLKKAANGCEIIFHCAAWASDRGSREDFFTANVTGTKNIVEAAINAKCQKFIHVSSISVYGFQPKDGTDETFPYDPSSGLYSETKVESEKVVKLAKEKLPAVIIRPGAVYGPRSGAWTVRPVKAIKDGKMFLIAGGTGLCNYVYIDNLIDAMLIATKDDKVLGEDFIITDGRSTPWHEFFGYYGRMFGINKLKSLPLPIAYLAALTMEISEKFTGKKAPITRVAINFLTRQATYNTHKAKSVLGYEPKINLIDGMKLTEEWLRKENLI